MALCFLKAVIIAVYYFGLVTMMARDLSYPQISIQGLNTTQDTSDQKENDPDIVKIVISYFPIMPLMQVLNSIQLYSLVIHF